MRAGVPAGAEEWTLLVMSLDPCLYVLLTSLLQQKHGLTAQPDVPSEGMPTLTAALDRFLSSLSVESTSCSLL